MSEEAERRLLAAEKTIAVLKRKVVDLYNGERTAIQRQLDAARRREEDNRRKREVAEARAGELIRYSQTLEAEVARRTEAAQTILDNVTFGFLVVGQDLVVQPETTRSCVGLFNTPDIEGRPLPELLGLSQRGLEEFQLACDQVFEDILPAEVSLGQMRQRFPIAGGSILRAEGSVIRDVSGGVRAMLFSVSDITALEDAMRDSNNNRTLVGILRQEEAFLSFLADTRHQLLVAEGAVARRDDALVRRVVHTLKGNASSYGLHDVVELAHGIEEGVVGLPELELLRGALRAFLDRNLGVLDIDFDRVSDSAYEVSRDQLAQLHAIVAGLPGGAPEQLRRWSVRLLLKSATSLLGPIVEFSDKLAFRLGKDIELRVEGGDTLVDAEVMRPVFAALPHLVRNAIDHGIEAPSERGLKAPRGLVRVTVVDDGEAYRLTVQDDGRGIDLPAVRRRAVDQGLVDGIAIGTTDDDVSLIFLDGLSTALVTTHISGRGVGMSAVKAAVDGAGGRVTIDTTAGRGTVVALRVPKSLA